MPSHNASDRNPAVLDQAYFDIVRADTPRLLDEAYRLRHQVYCLEKGFEEASAHRGGRETDVDDDRSVHALLVHRRTGTYAATVRVILPRQNRPLPTEHILAAQQHSLTGVPATTTAEISRFLVAKQFRRRRGEELYPDVAGPVGGPAVDGERRTAPYITFGLIRGVLEICTEHNISHLCAVMDPALIRILRRFGLDFEEIGELVNYRGILQPCVARLDDLVERSRANATPLWQYAAGALQSQAVAA